MAIITGKPHAELAEEGCPLDMIPIALSRRAEWLGHLLRMDEREPPRLLLRELIVHNATAGPGSLINGTVLDQAPPKKGKFVHTGTFESLVSAA